MVLPHGGTTSTHLMSRCGSPVREDHPEDHTTQPHNQSHIAAPIVHLQGKLIAVIVLSPWGFILECTPSLLPSQEQVVALTSATTCSCEGRSEGVHLLDH